MFVNPCLVDFSAYAFEMLFKEDVQDNLTVAFQSFSPGKIPSPSIIKAHGLQLKQIHPSSPLVKF